MLLTLVLRRSHAQLSPTLGKYKSAATLDSVQQDNPEGNAEYDKSRGFSGDDFGGQHPEMQPELPCPVARRANPTKFEA